MQELFRNHRSIRKYRPDPVPEALIQEILEAGIRASTTGNMQVYSVIVTRDPMIREELHAAHFKQEMVRQAPVHLTFCADFHRFSQWCIQRGAEPGYANFLSFFTASIDALLVSQNVALAAEAHGLGICYLGTVTYMAAKIAGILNLPPLVVPVAALVVGYPDQTPPLTDRLPIQAILHNETYQTPAPEAIDQWYHEKENLEFYRQIVAENQSPSLAHVFTDKRYNRKDNEFFSEAFLKFIKSQGFMGDSER